MELNEIIRVSYFVACPIVFILLCDPVQEGQVLPKMVNLKSIWLFTSIIPGFWAG